MLVISEMDLRLSKSSQSQIKQDISFEDINEALNEYFNSLLKVTCFYVSSASDIQ